MAKKCEATNAETIFCGALFSHCPLLLQYHRMNHRSKLLPAAISSLGKSSTSNLITSTFLAHFNHSFIYPSTTNSLIQILSLFHIFTVSSPVLAPSPLLLAPPLPKMLPALPPHACPTLASWNTSIWAASKRSTSTKTAPSPL